MMDQNKLDMYLMTNQKYFPPEKMNDLKNRLSAIDDQKFSQLSAVELKDPTTLLLVSIFLGGLGIEVHAGRNRHGHSETAHRRLLRHPDHH